MQYLKKKWFIVLCVMNIEYIITNYSNMCYYYYESTLVLSKMIYFCFLFETTIVRYVIHSKL